MAKSTNNGRFVSKEHTGRFESPGKAGAEKAREIAEGVRKTRGTFDRDKFDKFVDNNPLLSNLHLLAESDD